MAAVPNASLNSNKPTCATSAVGTAEQTTARSVMAKPEMALSRRPAFQALANRLRSRNPSSRRSSEEETSRRYCIDKAVISEPTSAGEPVKRLAGGRR